MKKKYFLFALLLALPFVGWAVGGEEPTSVTTEDGLNQALSETAVTEIQLTADITLNRSVVIPANKTVTLDLNGKSLTLNGGAPIQVNTKGNLTIKDSSEPQTGLVKGMFAVCPVNGTSTSPAARNATITIEGGNFESVEFTVLTGYTTGNTINIKGGKFTATDNAVLGANGTAGCGGNTWNITGGEFNGKITSNGYNAFAIFAANDDVWNISGGTFNVTNGAGIVQRGGVVNVSGGTFNCTGTTTGKYGDNATAGPAAAIYFDAAAGYPGLKENSALNITGGTFTSEADNVVVTEAERLRVEGVTISGGTFSDKESAAKYLAQGLAVNEDGEVVEATSLYTWTIGKTSATYIGAEIDPAITVTNKDKHPVSADNYVVKVFTDKDCTDEVEEGLLHAGTYYVNVFTEDSENEDGETQYKAIGNGEAKQFVINKNTVEIVLQQIYLPYGSALSTLEPVYVLKTDKDDKTPTDQIVIENLGKVAKGSNWAVGEEGETLEPDNVRNYTTLGKPKAFVGRTYDEEGNIVEVGYEDYIATTNTSSANIVATKGTLYLDIDADDLTKVFGFDDPEYTFTAKSQDGLDVENVTVTREDKGTVEGEAVGPHDLTVNYPEDHYDLVIGDNGATLTITPFDLNKDNAEEGGYGEGVEDYTEKFEVEAMEEEYNGNTQYPDPVVTFHHALLGDIVLSDFEKWETVGVGKTYTTDDYWYKKAALKGQYNGDYNNHKVVARNAETAEVEAKATIQVHAVEGEGKNFTGAKTQQWTITPAPLKLQVANQETSYGYAIAYELETVDPSDVVEADAEKKNDILTDVSNAIKKEGGFVRTPEGEGAGLYTVSVSEEAQAAVAVIMAASNYALEFIENENNLNVKKAEIIITALAQTIKYEDFIEEGEVYGTPVPNLVIDADGEDATVKVEGYIPDGKTVADLVELSCDVTAIGTHEGAIKLTPKSSSSNLNITLVDGDLTIEPLSEIHLAYDNVEQALQDHKGYGAGENESMKVYLPARRIKTAQWYSMVLPFDFYVPTLSQKLGYASVALLDEDVEGNDVHFNTFVGKVEANKPFLFKAAPTDEDKFGEDTQSKASLKEIAFDDVTIGDINYNVEDEDPFVEDKAGHKFVGSYKTVEVDANGNMFAKVDGLGENDWFISTADGEFYSGKATPNHKILTTEAYLTEVSAEARIFIDEQDGTATAINHVGIANESAAAEGWYTVNGVKLNAAPTQKGIYIKNGKKVTVK